MLSRIRTRSQEDEGFTLIELLVVIIIIGILAAIAIPVFLNQRQKGFDAQAKSDARNLATMEETYLTDNTTYFTAATAADVPAALKFRKSGNVSSVVVTALTDAATADAAANSKGYCITVTSASGTAFTYNSFLGTVGTAACPS